MSQDESGREAYNLLVQVATLVDRARANSYALALTLASTPYDKFTHEEIDAICQLAYEVFDKLTSTNDAIKQMQQKLDM